MLKKHHSQVESMATHADSTVPVTSWTTWGHLKCPCNYLDILSGYFLFYKFVA